MMSVSKSFDILKIKTDKAISRLKIETEFWRLTSGGRHVT